MQSLNMMTPGADPGFRVRGGALKKIAPSGGRRENVGVFRVKNNDYTPNFFSPILGGGRAPGAPPPPPPPPWIRPWTQKV